MLVSTIVIRIKLLQITNKILAACFLLLVSLPSYTAESIKQSLEVSDNPVINIDVAHAEVSVISTDKRQVSVYGELSGTADGYSFDSSGNAVDFTVDYPSGLSPAGNFSGTKSKLEFLVPSNSTINIANSSGNINIAGISAQLNIETVNGDISLQQVSGNIRIYSENGKVMLGKLSGVVEVEAINGRISDRGSSGQLMLKSDNAPVHLDSNFESVELETTVGNVIVRLQQTKILSIESVNAQIQAAVVLAAGGTADISSIRGDVSIAINRNVSAEFQLEAAEPAYISNRLSDHGFSNDEEDESSILSFSLGKGEGQVNVRTESGSIKLAPL